ncbi:hypothetical protein INT43_004362 [Umbelopsis isabellina]|uniref:Mid2 domain-containing protein n=1 Tax=Mortierella isabellina TaxID=91625 RepID=A0A8H7UCC1_MORIS|nr:hypothetical protein INT43_004362 [Umbelopsis isabellina]
MKLYWLFISVVCVLQVAGQQAPPDRTTTTSTRIPSTTTAPSPSSTTTSSPPTTTTSSLPPTTTTTSSIPSTTTTSSIPSTTTSSTSSTHSTTTTSSTSTQPTTSQLSSATSATTATSSTPVSTPTFGNHDTGTSLSGGSIAGIVIGCVAGLALLGLLAFCCIGKRRRHLQDEDYLRSTNYADDPPTEMKEQVGEAPVAGFSPAAAYRQQHSMYPQPEDEWGQQDFTRQRSMRYTTSPYGQQQYQEQSPFETPHMHEGQYIGHPSDRYADPSSYQNPNTPTREPFNSLHGAGTGAAAGASAAGLAAMAYNHNQQPQYDSKHQYDGNDQYGNQAQYDQYNDNSAGDDLVAHNDQYEGEATSSSLHRPDEARSISPQRDEPQSLPPPHGLGNRWDLYNYAYTPPSTSPNLGPKK